MRFFLCLPLLLAAASTVQAQTKLDDVPGSDNTNHAGIHALPTEKLEAIRQIGRHVLMAKKKGRDETVDKQQLSELRSTVDQLIEAEVPPIQASIIKVDNNASPTAPAKAQATGSPARDAARNHAWKVSATLRQDASQLTSKTKSPAKHEEYSAGFPVGQQRGRLYEKWADKLETSLDGNNTKRVAQLRDLRDRLNPERRVITKAPLVHDTPTLQVTPWEDPKGQAKKNQRNNKSSQ